MQFKIQIIQFHRKENFKANIKYLQSLTKSLTNSDFILVGGEFSIHESARTDPYPTLCALARQLNANLVVPINANFQRFPTLKEVGFSSIQIINRVGDIVGIQDKQDFYPKEKPWFKAGKSIHVFTIENIKIGLIRGLDIFNENYMMQLKSSNIIFFSTMAVDNSMIEKAKSWSKMFKNTIIMSSFIGKFVGLDFIGNAAIIKNGDIIQHLQTEGILSGLVDL